MVGAVKVVEVLNSILAAGDSLVPLVQALVADSHVVEEHTVAVPFLVLDRDSLRLVKDDQRLFVPPPAPYLTRPAPPASTRTARGVAGPVHP